MALRRKTRKLPQTKDKDVESKQMSFFDPVYQTNDMSLDENDTPDRTMQRQTSNDTNQTQSNETLDAQGSTTNPDESPVDISTERIVDRIKQIQTSIEQAQMMLDSMEQFRDLVPGSEEQCEKLRIIIGNLAEQQNGYVNLLNLITLTNEERMTLLSKISAMQRAEGRSDDEEDEDDEEVRANERKSRPEAPSPVRPRIESKIGFIPQATIPSTPTVNASLPSWDIDGNNRHDNSNYDSLVGSLKSDTINWKDHQSTSDDEGSEATSEKEMERHLMLQKEQLRALQGQQRALLALKRRSEQRLIEQQQLMKKQPIESPSNENPTDEDLLGDINNLRERLKLLRDLYEEKHQNEIQQMKNPSKKTTVPSETRLKSLDHVRERLHELEEIVSYYQYDLMNQPEEETTVYEETPIQPDDVQRLKSLIMQQKQQQQQQQRQPNENTPQNLDQLSNELATKRLELEQAKSALTRLQQMVETIEPDRTTNEPDLNTKLQISTGASKTTASPLVKTKQTSLLSSILSPQTNEQSKPMNITSSSYADAKMAAQHREIERLVESRQRLHTIKDQIASLHQSMTTPTIPTKTDSPSSIPKKPTSYQEQYLEARNRYNGNRPPVGEEEDDVEDEESDFEQFECESGDGEEIDDDADQGTPSRMKQGNFHAPEDILAEHEERLLNKSNAGNTDLTGQMRDICNCLTSFIQEQKAFNRHIEEHIANNGVKSASPSIATAASSTSIDPVFNQFQQQVLTQGLIVNLNAAYREIAVLQSEVNQLQSENHRLTSSLSSMDRSHLYSRENSKESIYSLDQVKNHRPRPRSRFEDYNKGQHHYHRSSASAAAAAAAAATNAANKFENSSKTSFNSQSTGQQTAIHVTKPNLETTPIKHERNGSFHAARLSSPKPVHLRSYDVTSNSHRRSSKENVSKPFVIRRRPLTNDQENNRIQSDVFQYHPAPAYDRYAKYQRNNYDDDDDDDDDDASTSEKEQQTKDLSRTISNIRPSAYYASMNQEVDNLDIQTLELQVKSIMVQLIPFMRLHINDIFNQSILNQVRERIVFLFKQQPDSASIIRHFHNQFSESLGKAIEKYSGTTIRECAGDLIRDISDVAFDELVKYKLLTNNDQLRTISSDENLLEPLNKSREQYSTTYDPSHPHYFEPTSSVDDGDNETKYQIELAESESRPLMLIGSDEEDNDSDQEENKDSELETAVSRQETNVQSNENPVATELHSNGHEYILVDRSANRDVVTPDVQPAPIADDPANDENDNDE